MMNKLFCLTTIAILMSGCQHSGEPADKPFLETTWSLTKLTGEDIRYAGSQAPHLRFEQERVTGNDGCNNIFGPYKRDDSNLGFGLLSSTRMACPQIEGFNIMFNKMLIKTTRYQISGKQLEFYAGDELLARFIADEKN